MAAVADEPLPCANSLAALVAIVRAAHLAGDRSLERTARRELRDRYGVDLSIRRSPRGQSGENDAQV
jgi:hypothetical protein